MSARVRFVYVLPVRVEYLFTEAAAASEQRAERS